MTEQRTRELKDRVVLALGEPQSNKAALPKTKGPASPQGIKSFYYLMIPTVVPEIPLWSHYALCWGWLILGCRWTGGDRYLQYREGRGLHGDSEMTISSRALRTLCFVLVGTELPGMSFMFVFFRKRCLKPKNNPAQFPG